MAYIKKSVILDAPKEKVFEIISNVENWGRFLPSGIVLKLNQRPIEMDEGAEYEFSYTRLGVTHTIQSRIESFEKNKKFTERHIIGFFSNWLHTFQVEDHGDGKTVLSNTIDYRSPLGIVGTLLDDLFLKRDLEKVLEKGYEKLKQKLKRVN